MFSLKYSHALKYLARISIDGNNPLLMDAFSLSKSLHSVGTYSWFSYVDNICKFDNIDINIIQDNNNSHKNSSFNKDKGNNKITELRTILQRESQTS
jgi:hypothetical protein